LLLLDGHESHKTYEFLDFCVQHKILVYFLRPHTSHITQPLDVGVFQAYKHWHGEQIGMAYGQGIATTTKVDFLDRLTEIRRRTFKKSTIQSGWRRTGLYPWDPDVVLRRLQPQTTPEPPEQTYRGLLPSPVWLRTPENAAELQEIWEQLEKGVVQHSDASEKFSKASEKLFNVVSLLEQRLKDMSAAQAHKNAINASKRRVGGLQGEPSSMYVANARKAILTRKEKERTKLAKKQAKAAKIASDKAEVDQVQPQANQTLENVAIQFLNPLLATEWVS
jgi:hypothetical protein